MRLDRRGVLTLLGSAASWCASGSGGLSCIIEGDPLPSVRGDVAEECRRIVDPVCSAWSAGDAPMEECPAGSTGPDHRRCARG